MNYLKIQKQAINLYNGVCLVGHQFDFIDANEIVTTLIDECKYIRVNEENPEKFTTSHCSYSGNVFVLESMSFDECVMFKAVAMLNNDDALLLLPNVVINNNY